MHKVISALLKLKYIHYEYRDIVINNVEPDELFDDFPDSTDVEDDNIPMDVENNTGSEDTSEQNLDSEQHDADNQGGSAEQNGLALDTCLQILVSICSHITITFFVWLQPSEILR